MRGEREAEIPLHRRSHQLEKEGRPLKGRKVGKLGASISSGTSLLPRWKVTYLQPRGDGILVVTRGNITPFRSNGRTTRLIHASCVEEAREFFILSVHWKKIGFYWIISNELDDQNFRVKNTREITTHVIVRVSRLNVFAISNSLFDAITFFLFFFSRGDIRRSAPTLHSNPSSGILEVFTRVETAYSLFEYKLFDEK